MELNEKTIEELEARKAEIANEIESPEADLDALEEEARAIKEELESRAAAEAKRAEIRSQVAQGVGTVVQKFVEEKKEIRSMEEIRNSKEYIEAYANYIKTENDAECRALLTENVSGTVPVPELVYDIVKTAWEKEGIMSRVHKSYAKGNLKVGFEISATGAVIHTEGSGAVDEENLVLGIVELIPKNIKKWISISDEALSLSSEAFLRYVYNELAYRIAKKAADEVVAKIIACGTVSTTTCPSVPAMATTTVSLGLVAKAIGHLSDEANDLVLIMNRETESDLVDAAIEAKYAVDPFRGIPVVHNNTLKAFSAASTGDTVLIVGDLDHGFIANFPDGEEIGFKFDDTTLMTSDLVRVLGKLNVALGVVAPDAFVKVTKS